MTQKIEKLIVKYITKSATADDLDILSEWIKEPENETIFKDYVQIHYAITFGMNKPESKIIIEKLLLVIKRQKSFVYTLKRKFDLKYAAAILIGVLISVYFYENKHTGTPTDINTIENTLKIADSPIKAGKDKATLTLDDGKIIVLEKDKTYKTDKANSNGEKLVYNNNINKTQIAYNYLTIPRGGQFHVVLSDGTEVWLNSESQLKYPVTFTEGTTREVELVYGEGYFDVSPSTNHNGSKFKVINKNQEIEVLGTEFNIKAYKGEDILTTLIEGKVTVSNSIFKQNLVPNEQSKLNLKNKSIIINNVDVYSETSWKKGLFSFKRKSLKEIMIVLSRWYDVDVKFKNTELEKIKFNGVLSKNDNMEDILAIIKNTNFINTYDITGKNITIK